MHVTARLHSLNDPRVIIYVHLLRPLVPTLICYAYPSLDEVSSYASRLAILCISCATTPTVAPALRAKMEEELQQLRKKLQEAENRASDAEKQNKSLAAPGPIALSRMLPSP